MTCPLCSELAASGLEQDHPDYPNPKWGDAHHGQYDPEGDMSELNYGGPDDD